MSSGAVACGSRTGSTTEQHHLQPTTSPVPLPQQPPELPSNWRTVHSGRLDKITGQCLWNACKALIFGVVLLLIGATMATIGYYADSLSMMEDEKRGNVTIKVRNVSKQLHTLSYVGPIIMGVGGFVIVAACVMTFEARDSAAKIVPARFRCKLNQQRFVDGEESAGGQELCILAAKCGTTSTHLVTSAAEGASWEHRVQRLSGGEAFDRLALTTAFIEFSQNIQKSIDSDRERHNHHNQNQQQPNGVLLKQRCPSAPDLMPDQLILTDCDWHTHIPEVIGVHIYATDCRLVRQEPNVKRLQVNLLPRQAISVDNPGDGRSSPAGAHFGGMNKGDGEQAGSSTEVSMTMDLHLPDCPVTLTVKDESKRSDDSTSASSVSSGGSESTSSSGAAAAGNRTSEVGRSKESAKRRPLVRQRPVERHPDSDTEEEVDGGGASGQAS